MGRLPLHWHRWKKSNIRDVFAKYQLRRSSTLFLLLRAIGDMYINPHVLYLDVQHGENRVVSPHHKKKEIAFARDLLMYMERRPYV